MPKTTKFIPIPFRSGPSCYWILSAPGWAAPHLLGRDPLAYGQAGWKTAPDEPFAPNQVWVKIWNYLLRLVHRVGNKPLLLGHSGKMIQIVKEPRVNGDRALMAMAEKGVET